MALASFNHFPQIALNLHKATAPMVAHTAQYIAETYAASAARRTGFMATSAYYRTVDTSTYGQGEAPPTDDVYLLPECDAPANDQEAYAAVAANYSEYVELGHHTRSGSWVSPQPSWYPSVDLAAGEFEAQGAQFEARIAELI